MSHFDVLSWLMTLVSKEVGPVSSSGSSFSCSLSQPACDRCGRQAQEELCKVLYKVGYLNIDNKDDVKISDFWSNTVYHGIFMRSSEIAGKRAVER